MYEQLELDFGIIWVNPIKELIKAILIIRRSNGF